MTRRQAGQYMVKLDSNSKLYFQALLEPSPGGGSKMRRYKFPPCKETNGVEVFRTLPTTSPDVWQGTWADRAWKFIPPSGWTPKSPPVTQVAGQEQPEQGGEVQLQHQPEPPVDPVDNAQGGEQGEAAGEEEGTLCVKNTSVALNPEQDPVAHSVSDSEAERSVSTAHDGEVQSGKAPESPLAVGPTTPDGPEPRAGFVNPFARETAAQVPTRSHMLASFGLIGVHTVGGHFPASGGHASLATKDQPQSGGQTRGAAPATGAPAATEAVAGTETVDVPQGVAAREGMAIRQVTACKADALVREGVGANSSHQEAAVAQRTRGNVGSRALIHPGVLNLRWGRRGLRGVDPKALKGAEQLWAMLHTP